MRLEHRQELLLLSFTLLSQLFKFICCLPYFKVIDANGDTYIKPSLFDQHICHFKGISKNPQANSFGSISSVREGLKEDAFSAKNRQNLPHRPSLNDPLNDSEKNESLEVVEVVESVLVNLGYLNNKLTSEFEKNLRFNQKIQKNNWIEKAFQSQQNQLTALIAVS